jgi:EF-P beta-lysylation protein EpmB
MIPQTELIRQVKPADSQSWQYCLAHVIRDPKILFELLQLDINHLPAALRACQEFPLRVPMPFIKRMKKGDWNDPLLKQVLPLGQELEKQPGFSSDPLEEANSNPLPGIIHKYQGRVLLIVSGGCAINCRYCFRRHFPYKDNNPGRSQWQPMLDYIRADDSIHEVILSGGDPLAASDSLLSELVSGIASIPHVSTLRVHSRLPIVIPQRITDQCLQWLTSSRLKPVMVIHCNHPNEIDNSVQQSLQTLKSAGVTLLNQTVLLAGINDNEETLIALSERLFQAGVLPYYLHLLDKVQGAAHFDVSKQRAQQLTETLLTQLPGYLVPRLVQELPGAESKVPIPIALNSSRDSA